MKAYASMRRRFSNFASSFSNVNRNMGKYRNLFIAQLIHLGQLKSIPMASAALNFYYGRLDEGDADLHRLLVDSAKRGTSPVVHRKKATQDDIDAVVRWALRDNTNKAITDACIILLSFSAFLRISEVASVQKAHLENKGQGIWWLKIPKSKSDQMKIGTTVAFKIRQEDSILWQKFMDILKSRKREHFIFATSAGDKPTTDDIRKRMKEVLKEAGLSKRALTSHSFRGGAATVALRNGASHDEIKRVGRWKSTSAMLHYIEPTPIKWYQNLR